MQLAVFLAERCEFDAAGFGKAQRRRCWLAVLQCGCQCRTRSFDLLLRPGLVERTEPHRETAWRGEGLRAGKADAATTQTVSNAARNGIRGRHDIAGRPISGRDFKHKRAWTARAWGERTGALPGKETET